MARRRGLFATIAREAAQAQRRAEQERKRQLAEVAREARQAERQQRDAERFTAALALQERQEETAALNERVRIRLAELEGLLAATLSRDDTISFDGLRIRGGRPEFVPPPELARSTPPPEPLKWHQRLVPGAEGRYQRAVEEHTTSEQRRQQQLAALRQRHQETAVSTWERNAQDRDAYVDEFQTAYRAGDPDAIIAYNEMVLHRSEYPAGFPQSFRVTYAPESKLLVIDYQLPGASIVPAAESYTYVKARDAIQERPRKLADAKARYEDVVASIALRTLHEVFEADQGGHLSVVAFNGFVLTVDPMTGKDVAPYLLSVRITHERLAELNLARVDKRACLRNLGAQVSPRPSELQAVKPIVEFDMVDRRFIDREDVLSGLDDRPNLMDLTPTQFEHLVGNLFQKLGLETRVTQSSRDGGVDAIAYDLRPIVGGKVVIQAKRYRHTVGVSAVRDLAGTMDHERANKGILVTTSGYGKDAYDFAEGKPIELIDGGGLLHYLDQVGVRARIVFPQDG